MAYRLHWTPLGWNSFHRRLPHSMKFETLEEIKDVMSKHYYTNEYVTDPDGFRVEMDWGNICPKRD